MTPNETYQVVQDILNDCVDEEKNSCAIVVGYDYESQVVKIYGINIEEWEVPELLHDAAETTGFYVKQHMDNRTLN